MLFWGRAKMKKIDTLQIQTIIGVLIFALFFLGVFLSLPFLPYLLIPLIAINIVFLFINRTGGFFLNILLIGLSFLLFIIFIEYIACIIGALFSFLHALRIVLKYRKSRKQAKETKKDEKKQ